DAQTRAALVEAAGESLREGTADIRYAHRAAAVSADGAAHAPRDSRRAGPRAPGPPAPAGTVMLPQPAGVDVRLDRLTATAEGASWSLTEPARIVYARDVVGVDCLALGRGPQKIEAAGAVAVGDATARAVPADRPLRLTLTDVDL